MEFAGNSLLISLARLLGLALTVYMWMVVIRAVISWFSPHPNNPVVQFLARATDPALAQIRRLVPVYFGGIDFSPIILILLIVFVNDFAVLSLQWLGRGGPFAGILGIFILSLIRLVQGFLFAVMIVLIVRAVLSWISPDPYNPIVRFVYGVTEPILHRLRTMLPLVYSGIDFSPVLLIVAIYFANSFLDQLRLYVGQTLMG